MYTTQFQGFGAVDMPVFEEKKQSHSDEEKQSHSTSNLLVGHHILCFHSHVSSLIFHVGPQVTSAIHHMDTQPHHHSHTTLILLLRQPQLAARNSNAFMTHCVESHVNRKQKPSWSQFVTAVDSLMVLVVSWRMGLPRLRQETFTGSVTADAVVFRMMGPIGFANLGVRHVK